MLIRIIFYGILLYVSYKDWKEHRIPDGCCALIGWLALFEMFLGRLVPPLSDRLVGMFCVSVPMLLLSAGCKGVFGGGDIKLLAFGGFFLGSRRILWASAAGILFAGIWCVFRLFQKRLSMRSRIALGPFLSAGMVLASLIYL